MASASQLHGHMPASCIASASHLYVICQSAAWHLPVRCMAPASRIPFTCQSAAWHLPLERNDTCQFILHHLLLNRLASARHPHSSAIQSQACCRLWRLWHSMCSDIRCLRWWWTQSWWPPVETPLPALRWLRPSRPTCSPWPQSSPPTCLRPPRCWGASGWMTWTP